MIAEVADGKVRCDWSYGDPLLLEYHDREWGVPLRDDKRLFEMLILEGAQAGLSWLTVLKKRENYRKVFDHFDPEKISHYNEKKVAGILQNEQIIRNRLKVNATVLNAKKYLEVKKEFGSFDDYIWSFARNKKPMDNNWKSLRQIPATSRESDAMSADLKKRGFKFVGSTICYAFMQAVGMVNDHQTMCFRYMEILKTR
ncbi:MAG: DNA-3-methyladenine glycosylase I [Thaumarchaeota archaeon]|nr:DNA-3-methyladenine glycosylase I [Nitrososphaerota archaeon]